MHALGLIRNYDFSDFLQMWLVDKRVYSRQQLEPEWRVKKCVNRVRFTYKWNLPIARLLSLLLLRIRIVVVLLRVSQLLLELQLVFLVFTAANTLRKCRLTCGCSSTTYGVRERVITFTVKYELVWRVR